MDIIGLLFPKKCINCGKGEKYLCEECLLKIKIVNPVCAYCQKASIDGLTHFSCRKRLCMNGFTCFWDYAGVIRRAILALKYKFAKEVSKEIVEKLVQKLHMECAFLGSNCYLVPIPIHRLRENWRGFNQSSVIGKQIAEKMGWKFRSDVLVKIKRTQAQADLKGKARVSNVRGVYAVNLRYKLKNTSIILFDDVFTTGSTIKEAAKVLKTSGAGKVWGLTIAR